MVVVFTFTLVLEEELVSLSSVRDNNEMSLGRSLEVSKLSAQISLRESTLVLGEEEVAGRCVFGDRVGFGEVCSCTSADMFLPNSLTLKSVL